MLLISQYGLDSILAPSWNLSGALTGPSFKPLESGTDYILPLELVLLLNLEGSRRRIGDLSLRRIGDLQALLISPACLDFVKALLMPGLAHLPKYPFGFVSLSDYILTIVLQESKSLHS